MNALLSLLARAVIALVQALPLGLVARLGRAGGAAAYGLDARHRRVAQRNLAMCFPEKSPAGVRALARENFRRIGENFAAAVKTAAMSDAELLAHLRIIGAERLRFQDEHGRPVRNLVVAIGHFGNFEVFARTDWAGRGFQGATTYRGLASTALDTVLMKLRRQSRCEFFERRTEATALRDALQRGGLVLGLLADQNVGRHGVRIPFLGHDCYTSIAPAVLALRYEAPLHTGICHRIAPGRWEIEWGGEIPLRKHGQARTNDAIMRDVNRALEAAVRRDPANWFWVHDRWRAVQPGKLRKSRRTGGRAAETEAEELKPEGGA